jgi:hypothetical protein
MSLGILWVQFDGIPELNGCFGVLLVRQIGLSSLHVGRLFGSRVTFAAIRSERQAEHKQQTCKPA